MQRTGELEILTICPIAFVMWRPAAAISEIWD